MSVTIDLYKLSCEDNRIDKTDFLGAATSVSGTIRGDLDSYSPEISVQQTLIGYNYAHISFNNKWYFITDINHLRTGLSVLYLRCDPLYTYKDHILQLPVVAARAADRLRQSPYIVDSKLQFAAYKQIRTFNLGSFTGASSKILITAG